MCVCARECGCTDVFVNAEGPSRRTSRMTKEGRAWGSNGELNLPNDVRSMCEYATVNHTYIHICIHMYKYNALIKK